ncbi:type IV pilin protein [uncultured Thiodictyon sp.]|uniref:type IV pilin protein n=1 Tax=uncultured Thiodictyon sp. TaxID=1846217 RepID=UPI0025EC3067|nr:type IV pilin protein [uncultured Thiodictyon sp.]
MIAHPLSPVTLPPHPAGFTLIELLFVVGIIGILSAFAFPAYRDAMIRGRIPDALGYLAARRVAMDQYFQDNRVYGDDQTCGGSVAGLVDTASSQYFNFTCPSWTATTYTLQATGKNAMAGFTFTIDQSNTKKTTAVPSGSGWSLPSTNCWVTNKGGKC